MRRLLALHLPYLATDRIARRRSAADEQNRPLVLTALRGATQAICQVNPAAAAVGLRPGLSLGQAQAMAPQLVVCAADERQDRRLLERLAAWALRFSPLVEPVPPDLLLLDITGCQHLFGSERRLAQQLLQSVQQRGFHARCAVADTVGAAIALATAGHETLIVVPAEETSAYLAPLPPLALRLDPAIAAQLDALGVRTVGDLLMLPRATLPARFGGHMVERLQQALGESPEVVTPFSPRELSVARTTFEEAVREPHIVAYFAEQLLHTLFAELAQRQQALLQLAGVIYYDGPAPRRFALQLARAARSPTHVAELLRQRLEQIDVTPGVTGLVLYAARTTRRRAAQADLFERHTPEDVEQFGELLDRLASRLGHAALLRPVAVADWQPEYAYRYRPVVEMGYETPATLSGGERVAKHPSLSGRGRGRVDACEGESAAVREEETGHGHLTLRVFDEGTEFDVASSAHRLKAGATKYTADIAGSLRPLQLFERPVPIRVIALLPDGPPTWLFYHSREHTIVDAAGPERIETAWWRGRDVQRDYFRVTTTEGTQFWVFRERTTGGWQLHGIFA